MLLSNLFAPCQETFADVGDGDGGGANRDQYLFHPSPNIRFLFVFSDSWMIFGVST